MSKEFTFVTRRTKAPGTQRGYEIDWTPFAEGQAISLIDVTVDDDAMTIGDVALADGIVSFTATGGVDGVDYYVRCEVERADGDGDYVTLRIPVRDR